MATIFIVEDGKRIQNFSHFGTANDYVKYLNAYAEKDNNTNIEIIDNINAPLSLSIQNDEVVIQYLHNNKLQYVIWSPDFQPGCCPNPDCQYYGEPDRVGKGIGSGMLYCYECCTTFLGGEPN